MRTYLKIINPVIAVVTLLLCVWAATYGENKFHLFGIVEGGISTYFFAKGLYAFSTVFLLGQVLLLLMSKHDSKVDAKTTLSDIFYLVGLFGVVISAIIGMVMLKNFTEKAGKEKPDLESVSMPPQITVVENYVVKESRNLKIICKVRNKADFDWDEVELCAELLLSGRYSGTCCKSARDLEADGVKYIEIKSDDFETRDILAGLKYNLSVTGKKAP